MLGGFVMVEVDRKNVAKIANLARQLIMGDEADNAKIFEKVIDYGIGIRMSPKDSYDAFLKWNKITKQPEIYINPLLDENVRIFAVAYELGMIFLDLKWYPSKVMPSSSEDYLSIYNPSNKLSGEQSPTEETADKFANIFLFGNIKRVLENDLQSSISQIEETSFGIMAFEEISETERKSTEKAVEESVDYSKIIEEAKAERQVIVNKLINDLIGPLQEEVKTKNKYRKGILLAFSLYFLLITTMIFITINSFQNSGFTNNEAQITNFLITGLFVNIVGLALIIFKYLFDENNTFQGDD